MNVHRIGSNLQAAEGMHSYKFHQSKPRARLKKRWTSRRGKKCTPNKQRKLEVAIRDTYRISRLKKMLQVTRRTL